MSAAIEQARQYLAKLPEGAVEGDPELHEAIAHLSGVVAEIDEAKPVAYVSARALSVLAGPFHARIACYLSKRPESDSVALYAAPLSSPLTTKEAA